MGIDKYYGGKNRYAKRITDVIERYRGETSVYIEPFCGWCSVLSAIVSKNMFEKYEASDANKSIVMFFNEVSRGTFVPPENITREEYYALKKSSTPSAIQAFAGICYSWMGIWFNNYAADYAGTVFKNRDKIPEKLMRRIKLLKDVEFTYAFYDKYKGREGCFFYMDPPYKTRMEKYKAFDGTNIPFDTDEFWEFVRKLSTKNTVIVSEYEAPDDFECVFEFTGRHGIEKIFKLR